MQPGAPTILQITPRLDTGGAELSTIEITDAIVRGGGRALVATEGGRLASRITENGGEIVPFPAGTKNPIRILANARALERLIRMRGIDLVHARSRAPAWSALIAARRAGIPFITTYHGAYAEKGRLKRLYNSVMARAGVVIANSHYTAGLIRERYGTPEARIRVIHRGVDRALFRPEAVAADRVEALRQSWNVRPEQPVILQAARLTSWKGQRVLIDAVGHLHRHGLTSDCVVVFAGDAQGRDGYQASLAEAVRAHGLMDRVRFAGHVADIAAAYLAAHVTVVASTEPEAFGRSAIEAQAMGCPVISTCLGAPPETVLAAPRVAHRDSTGWLVAPGDPLALADALEIALGLPADARTAMGRRAQAHVGRHFTLDSMKRATLAVYDEQLNRGLLQRYSESQASTGESRNDAPPA